MISLIPPTEIKGDPSDPNLIEKAPHAHQSIALSPVEEGEYVILKDTKDSKTWYCAQVLEKLPDRIKVSYYTTSILGLPKYDQPGHLQAEIAPTPGTRLPQNLDVTHWGSDHHRPRSV